MQGVSPHADHFDPTKFDANGRRLVNGKPAKRCGRPAKVSLAVVERILELELIAKTAKTDLDDFLIECGFKTKGRRATILNELRKGWRPAK